MKSFIVFAGALVVLALASRRAEAAYDEINQYMVKNVKSKEWGENMEAAIDWLKELEVKKSWFKQGPISDLKLFTSLKQVADYPKCDDSDYQIMKANEKMVDLHLLYDEQRIYRRIDLVMIQIFQEHAKICRTRYGEIYRTKSKQSDPLVIERVENLAKARLQNGRNKYQAALLVSAANDPMGEYAKMVPDEITGKRVVDKDKIKQLVSTYIVKPCREFVSTMGRDIFIPAHFDFRTYRIPDGTEADYHIGDVYYSICQRVLADETDVVNHVINSASNFK